MDMKVHKHSTGAMALLSVRNYIVKCGNGYLVRSDVSIKRPDLEKPRFDVFMGQTDRSRATASTAFRRFLNFKTKLQIYTVDRRQSVIFHSAIVRLFRGCRLLEETDRGRRYN